MKRRKRFIRIRETLQSFDSLYSEINEYNTTFLSKIIFSFWLTNGTSIILMIYIVIFVPKAFPILCIMTYVTCVFNTYCLFLPFSDTSVTYAAFRTYKIMDSLFISYSKHNKHLFVQCICYKLQVCFN